MAQWGGRKQRSVCEAPVARRFEPCLLWAKILDPVGSGRASGLSLAWGTCHILGTQSQGTSVFISSSILMALIFPFPSLPTTYLMVLPSGSWECPLECVNCRAHLSLWVRAYLSQKKQLISQAQLTPAGRSTSVVCPAGAAPTVRPAGLRLPYGPAFSKSKEENQGWDQWKYWELAVHHQGTLKWRACGHWWTQAPAWVIRLREEGLATHIVGTQAKSFYLVGSPYLQNTQVLNHHLCNFCLVSL